MNTNEQTNKHGIPIVTKVAVCKLPPTYVSGKNKYCVQSWTSSKGDVSGKLCTSSGKCNKHHRICNMSADCITLMTRARHLYAWTTHEFLSMHNSTTASSVLVPCKDYVKVIVNQRDMISFPLATMASEKK